MSAEDALAGLEDLAAYEQQQAEVAAMLLEDPENEELQAIYNDLAEVIELARELQQGSAAEAAGGAAAAQADAAEQSAAADAAAHMPGAMAEHIKHAQHRSAFGGQGPAAWAVGATCRALYSGDNKWYTAVVESVTAEGGFVVVFEEYGTREEVGKDAIQLQQPPEEEGGYKGVAAPKRRRVDETADVQEMPKWLEVKPTDDEKTKSKKRKLAKAYKSRARFAKLDIQSKQKQDAWKRFQAGKGKKKAKTTK
ncbi:survival of motorneuron-related-splicing factor 30 [Micractinium conductrix]|uniref:Survival of motorneuron-related-splicing factor 30 n=1 Tax=Micractinium conductrix TaxID=554055 RepID=A0A2P6VKA9_9CHLO|nr:survival of motorneuron-related-splicing factor 30 [Micractinium conductrix]|eukprot:PSC74490.1 survival of motorneuron-related-splicing factor 30 [Micractinium conductrix]